MCSETVGEQMQTQEFKERTADFLYPASDTRCRLGLCRNCKPDNFKCKYSPYYVTISGMSESDIDEARYQCSGRSTLHVEPVGGEGGLIETPISNDPLPANLVQRIAHRNMDLSILIVVLLIGTYLLFLTR